MNAEADFKNYMSQKQKDKSMENELDEALNMAKVTSITDNGGFEGEIWLSTDGKQTVHVKADTTEGRTNGFVWAKKVYDEIKLEYGTKQELNKKTYAQPEKEVDTKSPGYCPIHKEMMTEREGKFGKFFSHNVDGKWCHGKEK